MVAMLWGFRVGHINRGQIGDPRDCEKDVEEPPQPCKKNVRCTVVAKFEIHEPE